MVRAPFRANSGTYACLATVAVVALVAGCSSSGSGAKSGSGDTSTTSSASGTGASSTDPITVFVTSSFTGTTYSDPEALEAAKASASTINAAGGVNGHKIVIKSCDDQETPAGATKCAQQAVQAKPAAITGVFLFGPQTFGILQPSGIPVVDADPIDPQDLSASNSYPINSGADAPFYGVARKVIDAGAKRVATLYGNSASDAIAETDFEQGIKDSAGTLVRKVQVTLGAADYSSYISTAVAGGVQGLLYAGTTSDLAKLVLAVKQSGFTGPVGIDLSGSTPATMKQLGNKADQLVMASSYFVPPSPQADPFAQSMTKYAPGAAMDPVSEGVWAAVATVASALKGKSDLSSSGLKTALDSSSNLSVGAFAPTLDFTKSLGTGDQKRLFTRQVVYYTVKDGQYVSHGGFYDPYAG